MRAAVYSDSGAYGLDDAGLYGRRPGAPAYAALRAATRPAFRASTGFDLPRSRAFGGMHFGLDRARSLDEAAALDDAGFSFGSIVHAVSSAAKAVGNVVKAVPLVGQGIGVVSNLASGVVHGDFSRVKDALTHDPIGKFIGAAASGQNLGKAAQAAMKAGIKDAGEALALATMVAPMVPGVGTGVAAALGAANALAHGQRIDDALLKGVRAAIPGGPLAQAAFDVAVNAAQGHNVTDSVLAGVRSQLPGGPAAQAAFDAAVALAHGKKLQDVALAAGEKLLPPSPYTASALDFARQVASGKNISQAALSTAGNVVMNEISKQGNQIIGQVSHAVGAGLPALSSVGSAIGALTGGQPGASPLALATRALKFGPAGGGSISNLLPANVQNVAAAMVNRPELRSVPLDQVARTLGVPMGDVRQAAASMVQSVQRVGESGSPALAPAPNVEKNISLNESLDAHLADLGSKAAAPAQSPSPSSSRRAVFVPRPDRLESVVAHLPQLRAHPLVNTWMQLASGQSASDAQGIDPAGAPAGAGKSASPAAQQWTWVVEPSSWPAKVAQQVTGDANRWKEFVAANPQVPRDSSGNFARFQPGDRLMLPLSWNPYIYADGSGYSGGKALPPATPALPIPPKPDQGNTYAAQLPPGAIAFVKAQLGKWGQRDGKGVIVPADYPGALDINPTQPDVIDDRFTSALASFQTWANQAMRAAIRIDGVLDKDTHGTLNAYDAGNYVKGAPGTPAPAPTPATPGLPPPLTSPPALPAPGTGAPPLIAAGGPPTGTTAAQRADQAKSGGGILPLLAVIGLAASM